MIKLVMRVSHPTIFIGYVIKKELIKEEFAKGTAMTYLFHPWFFIMRYLAPIAIVLIILEEAGVVNIGALLQMMR